MRRLPYCVGCEGGSGSAGVTPAASHQSRTRVPTVVSQRDGCPAGTSTSNHTSPGSRPSFDAYSFRLIATRKLYDGGTIVQSCGHLAGLAPGTAARVHPADLDRLAVSAGARVVLRSARTSVTVPVHPDAGVPRGSVALVLNQVDARVGDLVSIFAEIVREGTTSMVIELETWVTRPEGERLRVTEARSAEAVGIKGPHGRGAPESSELRGREAAHV